MTSPESPGEVLAASMRVAEAGVEESRDLMGRMLECADDVLFDMSEQTDSDAARRNYFDSMRMLRKSAQSLMDDFARTVREQRDASEEVEMPRFSLEDLQIRKEDDVETDITVGNIVSRVEGAASNELWEFRLRTEHLPEKTSLRTALECLSPKAVVNAFKTSLGSRDLPIDIRLIIFKLFERQFVADARLFYQSLNRELDSVGQSMGEVLAKLSPSNRRPPYERARKPAPTFSVPSDVIEDLQRLRAAGESGTAPLSAGHLQRIALLSQWFDETGSEWPEQERHNLQSMFKPATGIALTDSQFFTDPNHPARQLLAEIGPGDANEAKPAKDLPKLRSELDQMGRQREIPQHVDLLPPSALEIFLRDQRDSRQGTEERLRSARDQARAQIRKLGSGMDLPAGIARFLQDVWIPMVSAISMRFGKDSEQWRSSEKFLHRLFAACRFAKGPGLVDAVLDDLLGAMSALSLPDSLAGRAVRLLREGLSDQRYQGLLLDLETMGSRRKPSDLKGEEAPPKFKSRAERKGSTSDWRTALPFGGWFRVYDRATDRTVWMSAGVFYPEANELQFTGFDPSARVRVTKREFLADIKTGRAEAVSPTPAQVDALERLTATLD